MIFMAYKTFDRSAREPFSPPFCSLLIDKREVHVDNAAAAHFETLITVHHMATKCMNESGKDSGCRVSSRRHLQLCHVRFFKMGKGEGNL